MGDEYDEFQHFTPSAKAGVLHIRSLPDDVLLAVARDTEGVTPEFREVYAFMESLDRDGPGPTNPSWVTGSALEAAYMRDLIDAEQFDRYRANAGL